ncbi:MAG TPA: hypothetical protein VF759_00450 [Allosphingosinicella sp.]
MRKPIAIAAALASAATFAYATPAAAQATRTWVSGVGDDVNPCSRTAPCKTFAGAISKTAAGGEINCLDPGGFGAVSIIKSMTISCPYTEGGALAGGNGITFNMPATTDVGFIRGLDIFGVNPPTNGVRFVNNGSLTIEDTTIRRFNASGSFGVSYQPSGASRLYILNSTISDNGNGATGGGILIQPTGASGSAKVEMRGVRVVRNANNGIRIDTTGNTAAAGVSVVIHDSEISGHTANGLQVITALGTSPVSAMVVGASIANNTGTGISASGTGTLIRVADTTVTGNGSGVVAAGGGQIVSFVNPGGNGTNRVIGNSSDGAFTSTTPQN